MVEILKVKCLYEKVYVSPICSASSFLLERDFSNNTATLLDKIKFKDGHFQDLVMLAKSSSVNIRLVTLDYAGLTIDPEDLLKLIKKLKSIKEIVIYEGHNLKSYQDSSYCMVQLQRSLIVEHHLLKGPLYKFHFFPSPLHISSHISSPFFFRLSLFHIYVHQK